MTTLCSHPTLLSVSAFISFLRSFLLAIIFFSVLGLVTAWTTIDFLWFSSLRCLASARCFRTFCTGAHQLSPVAHA